MSNDPPARSRREAILQVALRHAERMERKRVVQYLLTHDPTKPERAYQHPRAPRSDDNGAT